MRLGRICAAMSNTQHTDLPFMKMHGLGNDFVVLDGRARAVEMSAVLAQALADRHRGVGFDQLAVIAPDADADAELIFYNADGSISAACGNATRCIARHMMNEADKAELRLRTGARMLTARDVGNGLTSVNMGPPETRWDGVPLAHEMDTLKLPIDGGPTATGMGNPHCTFFVDDAEAIDLAARGPEIEHHPLFPERTNVQFASLIAPDTLRMRVWERGTGITLASGSSSCATAVAAHRRGLTGPDVEIRLDGGVIHIRVAQDGVWMTGPTMHVFTGTLTGQFLESLT